MSSQIIVFNIDDEEFGVNITDVWKIIRMQEVTSIPNTKGFIKGVINLRGGIVVVIDLAMKLGLKSKEYDKDTRIIITELEDSTVGMIVDSATEVLKLDESQIEPAPDIIKQKINKDYIESVGILGERLLILLDLKNILGPDDIHEAKSIKMDSPQ